MPSRSRRSSTLTLAGNNTLDSLIFENNGGTGTPVVNIGRQHADARRSATPVTVTTSNALTVPTINPGTLAIGSGINTFDIGAPTVAGQIYTTVTAALNINSLVTGAGASILKTGNGILQISNAGNNYGGSTTISGGMLQLGVAAAIPNGSALTVGTGGSFNLNGFAETVGSLAGDTPATGGLVTNTGAAATLTVGFDNTDTSYAGVIANGVNLAKIGSGAQTLAGANTYTGTTTVSGGSLLVSGSLSGTTAVTANAGGTFGGSGSILTAANGSVTVAAGGFLAPTAGATPLAMTLGTGSVNISAAVSTLNSGSLLYTLDTTTMSSQVAVVSGTLNIGTGVLEFGDFNFSTTGGFGQGTYTLFQTNSAINGSLAASGLSGNVGGFDATLALNGDNVVLLVVPEPNALSLLAGSLGLALGLQRFRRRRA